MSDIQKLFEGQELSNEFVQKATTLIEAKIAEKEKDLQDAHDKKVEELDVQTKKYTEEVVVPKMEEQTNQYVNEVLIPEVNKYLSAAVTEWLEENKIAIESGMKVELAESFLKGMVGLVESHDFEIEAETVSKLDEMQAKLDEMSGKLNEAVEAKVETAAQLVEMKKAKVLAVVAADLADTQMEKFTSVCESVEYKSDEQYVQAIKTLKESYYPTKVEDQGQQPEVIAESTQEAPVVSSGNSYLDSLLKSL